MTRTDSKPKLHEARNFPIKKFKLHKRNYNAHPPEQLEHIKASLMKDGQYKNIVCAKDMTVLAGHGVLQAAKELGWSKLKAAVLPISPRSPVALQILAGDNEIAKLAEVNSKELYAILSELNQLNEDSGLLGTGYNLDSLELLSREELGLSDAYTKKVTAPVYKPKGKKPIVEMLYDRTKTDALVGAINKAGLPADLTAFLLIAAERHTVFSYANIAEYYCHASKPVQKLMEDSALVIIDYKDALAGGFVQLTKRLGELAEQEEDATL